MKSASICIYKILSLAFSYPEEGNWAGIQRHFDLCKDYLDGDLAVTLHDFMQHFTAVGDQIEPLRTEYLRIFDVGREISPYETEYMAEKVSRKPFELADIMGFYTAFGFGVSEEMQFKEAPDHIAVELEFMAILLWKEEFASQESQPDHLSIVQDARRKFFEEHLAKWGFFFCRRVQAVEDTMFYKKPADLLRVLLISECRRFSVDAAQFDRPMNRDPYKGVRGETLTC